MKYNLHPESTTWKGRHQACGQIASRLRVQHQPAAGFVAAVGEIVSKAQAQERPEAGRRRAVNNMKIRRLSFAILLPIAYGRHGLAQKQAWSGWRPVLRRSRSSADARSADVSGRNRLGQWLRERPHSDNRPRSQSRRDGTSKLSGELVSSPRAGGKLGLSNRITSGRRICGGRFEVRRRGHPYRSPSSNAEPVMPSDSPSRVRRGCRTDFTSGLEGRRCKGRMSGRFHTISRLQCRVKN